MDMNNNDALILYMDRQRIKIFSRDYRFFSLVVYGIYENSWSTTLNNLFLPLIVLLQLGFQKIHALPKADSFIESLFYSIENLHLFIVNFKDIKHFTLSPFLSDISFPCIM